MVLYWIEDVTDNLTSWLHFLAKISQIYVYLYDIDRRNCRHFANIKISKSVSMETK